MNLIKRQIEEDGWYIKDEGNYIMLSTKNFETEKYIDVEDNILCSEEGVFKNNRGKRQFLFDFGEKDKNLFATYIYIKNNQQINEIIYSQKNNIQNSNPNDIGNIFASFFTLEYLNENLNLDINKIKKDALNVVMDDKFYNLIYVKEDYNVILQGATTLNDLYCDIFKYLYLKLNFDDIIKKESIDLSPDEVLKLFQIYADKSYANPKKINEQKKTK